MAERLAERLCATTFADLFFCNSGAEAMECARSRRTPFWSRAVGAMLQATGGLGTTFRHVTIQLCAPKQRRAIRRLAAEHQAVLLF